MRILGLVGMASSCRELVDQFLGIIRPLALRFHYRLCQCRDVFVWNHHAHTLRVANLATSLLLLAVIQTSLSTFYKKATFSGVIWDVWRLWCERAYRSYSSQRSATADVGLWPVPKHSQAARVSRSRPSWLQSEVATFNTSHPEKVNE